MEGNGETEKKLEELKQSMKILREEKERLKSQQCVTCVHFILYKHEFYSGEWGYCDAHDRNVRKTQARYPWCQYEVKE
jgi:hypothetical protein